MDRGYTPHQSVALFGTPADRQVEELFTAEIGPKMPRGGWGNDATAVYKS